ncbi:MAG: enoyl-CoA hydratase/isomerase family protein [Bdellovibrionales bacterium]|nr:enoyl-CoA hydratase/isomerase family protein [Bdellovibrionales bacterium]
MENEEVKFPTLRFELRGGVGILLVNRPQVLNALNDEVLNDLEKFLDSFPKAVKCLIMTGEGEKSFVAGADIKEMENLKPEEAIQLAQRGQSLMNRIETLKVPTIAAVNGYALGGGFELALSCDFIVASEKAKFGLPEVGLGLIPGYGGTQRLARAVGKGKARMITLTADIYTAKEAFEWGIAVRVVNHDQLLAECLKLAEKITSRAPGALALAKRAIHEGYDLSQYEGLKLEAELFGEAFKLNDCREGMRAFLNKRPAQFKGE